MPAFSQLVANFLAATNENNAALASVKFDFSLLRVEAPVEWSPFGKALSERRRVDGEIGPIHRTARRLAALFEEVVPSTPKLIAAYGTRVSQIIREPGINPTGSRSDGPFEAFVGAEGTAMWAAATSGTSAIAVYLLACFLARAWDPRRSTSIWWEVIEGRKSQIRAADLNKEKVSESTLLSALQEITRQDLALWDAGARSWLRSADQVKQWHLTQLQLVTKDVGLQFNEGVTTYAKVMGSWTTAMLGLEALLSGMPQQISDASVLLACSAWHLFPDLIALVGDTVKVPFRDSLFPSNAIGTIGICPAGESVSGGIHWSLTLSHLQYYGEPVQAVSEESQPRVTFRQFRLAALGSLFFKWKVSQRRFLAAASFLTSLWKVLSLSKEAPTDLDMTRHFGWLYVFVQAASDFLEAHGSAKPLFEDYRRLVNFGHRRGSEFLGPGTDCFIPFFGLCNPHVSNALRQDTDADFGVAYMESIVQASDLSNRDGLIIRGHFDDFDHNGARPHFYEIFALDDHVVSSRKRNAAGEIIRQVERPCWLQIESEFQTDTSTPTYSLLLERRDALSARGYKPVIIKSGPKHTHQHLRSEMLWHNAPAILSRFQPRQSVVGPSSAACEEQGCQCLQPGLGAEYKIGIGDWRYGLYLTGPVELQLESQIDIQAAEEAITRQASPNTLWSYMTVLMKESWKDSTNQLISRSDGTLASNLCVYTAAEHSCFSLDACRALHSLAVADQVFCKISRPTVSLDCISFGIYDRRWRPQIVPFDSLQTKVSDPDQDMPSICSRMLGPIPKSLDRASAISCVTYFDSGNLDLDPKDLKHVFAMSCESSLYVAGVILSDPADSVYEYDIRHLVGNIGRKGISLLVAPQRPHVRELGSNYRLINHEPYDYKREDNFGDDARNIDQEVFFVESVISARDKGAWVADLDILGVKHSEFSVFPSVKCRSEAHCQTRLDGTPDDDDEKEYTSIDNWDELLDNPRSIGIFRAHGNWAARLAATAILFQADVGHCIGVFGEGDMCLQCTSESFEDELDVDFPQFCID